MIYECLKVCVYLYVDTTHVRFLLAHILSWVCVWCLVSFEIHQKAQNLCFVGSHVIDNSDVKSISIRIRSCVVKNKTTDITYCYFLFSIS